MIKAGWIPQVRATKMVDGEMLANLTELHDRYHKILVSRFSPGNGCFVREGEPLFAPVLPDDVQSKPGFPYYFLSLSDRKTRSKFGWVASVPEFSLGDFLVCHSAVAPDPKQIKVLQDLFAAISSLQDGTPVAGSFFSRGVEKRRVVLSFHKVFFYPASSDAEQEPDESRGPR
jgi:hypothetical protein